MRTPSVFRREQVGFSMTPMIDVVFLLIIFFLVSSHLAQRENRIQVDLPSAMSGQESLPTDVTRLTLTVMADGTTLLAGKKVTPQEMSGRLRDAIDSHGQDLELRIRSDHKVHYGVIEPIMSRAAANGIWNVTFAVLQSEAP